jgi:hypothetical protein
MTNSPTPAGSAMTMKERIARAIADGLGDDFDHAFESKSEWNELRGEKGGRYRDINEPRKPEYLAAATAVLAALREPTKEMLSAGEEAYTDNFTTRTTVQAYVSDIFTAMLAAATPATKDGRP